MWRALLVEGRRRWIPVSGAADRPETGVLRWLAWFLRIAGFETVLDGEGKTV